VAANATNIIRTGLVNDFSPSEAKTSGAKVQRSCGLVGTAEVVPLPPTIYETSSSHPNAGRTTLSSANARVGREDGVS
jgi:hypothetical protein